jgi:Zn-dependent protease with chaperone function
VIIVPHSPPPATVRSRALADALKATIADFRRREPKLSDAEIEGALARAHESSHVRGQRRRRAIFGAIAALAFVVGALVVAAGTSRPDADAPVVAIVAVGVAVVGVVMALLLRMLNDS